MVAVPVAGQVASGNELGLVLVALVDHSSVDVET
jgi:hypothetical protein